MGIVAIVMGAMMIGIAFLVRAYPNSISGYNTMSRKKKDNVDIEGLSRLMFKGFIVIGFVLIIVYYLLYALGLKVAASLSLLVVLFGGMTVVIVLGLKYDRNKGKAKYTGLFIMAGCILFVSVVLGYGMAPVEITVSDGIVHISGKYGEDIPVTDIADIELRDSIPAVLMRTNGFGMPGIQKGYFKVAGWGKCKLFIRSGGDLYMVITTSDGRKIIFSDKDTETTSGYYDRIREVMP